jgi:hypothetical protein
MDIENVLLTSGITGAMYVIYKTIQHYRLQSSCNNNNELVLSVVDITQPVPVANAVVVNIDDPA